MEQINTTQDHTGAVHELPETPCKKTALLRQIVRNNTGQNKELYRQFMHTPFEGSFPVRVDCANLVQQLYTPKHGFVCILHTGSVWQAWSYLQDGMPDSLLAAEEHLSAVAARMEHGVLLHDATGSHGHVPALFDACGGVPGVQEPQMQGQGKPQAGESAGSGTGMPAHTPAPTKEAQGSSGNAGQEIKAEVTMQPVADVAQKAAGAQDYLASQGRYAYHAQAVKRTNTLARLMHLAVNCAAREPYFYWHNFTNAYVEYPEFSDEKDASATACLKAHGSDEEGKRYEYLVELKCRRLKPPKEVQFDMLVDALREDRKLRAKRAELENADPGNMSPRVGMAIEGVDTCIANNNDKYHILKEQLQGELTDIAHLIVNCEADILYAEGAEQDAIKQRKQKAHERAIDLTKDSQ